jgi:hypothetical protein
VYRFSTPTGARSTPSTPSSRARYRAPCLLVEPGGAFALTTPESVLANMRALVAQYRAGGYRGAAIAHCEIRAQGADLALATVDWEVQLGDRSARFTNSYQLVRSDGSWRIAVSTLHGNPEPGSP